MLHVTEYASQTLPLAGVLVTEIEGAASALAGTRAKSMDAAIFTEFFMVGGNGVIAPDFRPFSSICKNSVPVCPEMRHFLRFYLELTANIRILQRNHTARQSSKMNLLQVFFAISGVINFVIALDISKRQKFNALHFLVFLGIGGGLLLFAYVPQALDLIGRIFGIPRGADVLVYGGIVFLSYFSLLLLNKTEKNREDTTRLIREMALHMGAPEGSELSFPARGGEASGDRPDPSNDNVAFLIRAYNEASRLEGVIDALQSAGFSNILVVDDGSRDGTSSILARRSDVMSVRHPQNR